MQKRQQNWNRKIKDGRIGFGVVGLGLGAKIHALQLNEIKDASLVAAYGRNHANSRKFAEDYGVKRWYTDYRQMLSDDEVDVVVITTPNGLHQDFAVPAAQAGKHVVVEKSIEITLERANAIVEACRENQVLLSVIYQLRFGNAVRKIKAAIDSGLFGRIFLCDGYDKEYREPSYYANGSWHGNKALAGGGCLTLQSTHIVDLLQWFMGPVDTIFAKKMTAVHKIELEDLVVAHLSFRSGAMGVLESSTCTYPAFKSRIELHGENGSAIVNAEYDELVLWNFKGSDDKIDASESVTFTDVSDPHQLPFIRHRYQLQDIIDAIKENREPLVTGEEAMKALVIQQAIYESTELGKEVKVKL